jgi:hypothetical protein
MIVSWAVIEATGVGYQMAAAKGTECQELRCGASFVQQGSLGF